MFSRRDLCGHPEMPVAVALWLLPLCGAATGLVLCAEAEASPATAGPANLANAHATDVAESEPSKEPTAADITDLDLSQLLNTEVGVGAVVHANLRTIPAVVEVLTADDIRALAVRDLRELMLHFASVYERSHSLVPMGFHTLRFGGGPAAHRLLLVIDDQVQLDELFEVMRPHHIPIEAIERVELLRGPASVLYGSGAMRAVLRVVTKRGAEPAGGATVLGDPVGHGGDLSGHAAQSLNVMGHPLTLRVDVQARQNERRKVELHGGLLGGTGSHRQQLANVASLVTVEHRNLTLRLQHELARGRILGFFADPIFDAGKSKTSFWAADVGYERRGQQGEIAVRFSTECRKRRLDVGRIPPFPHAGRQPEHNATDLLMDSLALNGTVHVAYRWRRATLSGGAAYRRVQALRMQLRYKDGGDVNALALPAGISGGFDDASGFVTAAVQVASTLSVQAGARLNLFRAAVKNHGGFFTDDEAKPPASTWPTAQAAIIWDPGDEVTVKLLYGRSYRSPSVLELYAAVDGFLLPNTGLKAETQDTLTAALDCVLSRQVAIRLDAFYATSADGIVLSTRGVTSQFVNMQEPFVSYGVNHTLHWQPLPVLSVSGSLTVQTSRAEGGEYGSTVAAMPRVLAALRASLDALDDGALRVSPSIRLRGPQSEGPTDLVADMALLWEIIPGVTLIVAGQNLLDRQVHVPYDDGVTDAYLHGSRALRLGLSAQL